MAILDRKITAQEIAQNDVSSVIGNTLPPDVPAAKQVFDKLPEFHIGKYNGLIDELTNATDGNSGADNIGSPAITGGGAATVKGQLQRLSDNKVDKVTGKGLSAEDYTAAEKTKLAGIQPGANAYTLPVATTTVLGGVKQGIGVEILADGTLNGLSAPAPDLVARAAIAQEATDRSNADAGLQTQITTNANDITLKAPVASPTFTGTATAPINTAYTTRQIRNVIESTADPSGGENGDIWLKYTP